MSQNIPIFIPTYISDQNYSPSRVQPRLLYYNGQVDCQPYYLVDGDSIAKEVTQFPYFDNYSVVTGSQFPQPGSKSLLFFNEQAVYGSTPTGSLFSEYWSNYVNLLYNPRTRLLNASAIIPLADYFKMELNDIVDFRGNYYHLRAINDYSLTDGTCKIQLLGPVLEGSIKPTAEIDCSFTFTAISPTTTSTTTIDNCRFTFTSSIAPATTTTSTTTRAGCTAWSLVPYPGRSSVFYYIDCETGQSRTITARLPGGAYVCARNGSTPTAGSGGRAYNLGPC
jgi:hypothetical protein